MLTTTAIGIIATVVAVIGVVSRLVTRSRPLHQFLPAAYRWIPDALAAAAGVLLLGLPDATTWLGVAEVVGLAVIGGALAAAPGATTPHDEEPTS
jgi:hypothetical protein